MPASWQKTAVDADFPEFVFDENDLFTLKGLVQQLLDESGFSRPQEAGNNVNLGHTVVISFQKLS